MPILRIPTPLRYYTNGQSEVTVQGDTVGAAMKDLVTQFPALRTHLFDGRAELRPFVNLFLNDQKVRDLQGLDTPLKEDDHLLIIPSIAGGGAVAEC